MHFENGVNVETCHGRFQSMKTWRVLWVLTAYYWDYLERLVKVEEETSKEENIVIEIFARKKDVWFAFCSNFESGFIPPGSLSVLWLWTIKGYVLAYVTTGHRSGLLLDLPSICESTATYLLAVGLEMESFWRGPREWEFPENKQLRSHAFWYRLTKGEQLQQKGFGRG